MDDVQGAREVCQWLSQSESQVLRLLIGQPGAAPLQFERRRCAVFIRPVSRFAKVFGPQTQSPAFHEERLLAQGLPQEIYLVFDDEVPGWDRGIPRFV